MSASSLLMLQYFWTDEASGNCPSLLSVPRMIYREDHGSSNSLSLGAVSRSGSGSQIQAEMYAYGGGLRGRRRSQFVCAPRSLPIRRGDFPGGRESLSFQVVLLAAIEDPREAVILANQHLLSSSSSAGCVGSPSLGALSWPSVWELQFQV